MKLNKSKLFLIAALLLGALLRLLHLTKLPIALFGDEIDISYQSWSIAQSGRDYFGNLFPVYFQSLTEWRMPGLVYVVSLFYSLFGFNHLWVRLVPALFGIINILQIYFLSEYFKKGSGKYAAFILAILPWHLHFSRMGFDVTLQMFFILLGIQVFFLPKFKLFSWPILLSSIYIYPTSTIFIPLLLFALVVFDRRQTKTTNFSFYLKTGLISLLILVPFLVNTFNGNSLSRFKGISIFSDQKKIDQIIVNRTQPWVTNPTVEKIYHNKLIEFTGSFIDNYLTAFSTNFLFLHGDPNYRHSINVIGEIYPLLLLPLLVGIYLAARNANYRFILFWLIIAPISACLTIDGGHHATRLFLMIAPLTLLISLGLQSIIEHSKNLYRVLGMVLIATLFFNLSSYWHEYGTHYRYLSKDLFYGGYQETFSYLADKKDSFDNIYLNNTKEPVLVPFAYFAKIKPQEFQKLINTGSKIETDNFSGSKFGEYLYLGKAKEGKLTNLLQDKDLYFAIQGSDIPGDWDWSKTPPKGITSIFNTYDSYKQPTYYWLTPSN